MEKEQENSYHKINLNWYPGHMAKTKKQIIEDLKLIDIVVEILDARIPKSSRNPDLAVWTKGKKKIIVLNKYDLADEKENKKWISYFQKQGMSVVLTNSVSGDGINNVIKEIEKVGEENKTNFAQKGRTGRALRVMVTGIPNVGKSSFINRITKKTSAGVGNKPGFTKQKQWIRVNEKIDLMDTPGILWPKLEPEEVAINLAITGTIKDEIIEKIEVAYYLLKYLLENNREELCNRYSLKIEDIDEILSNENQMENENIMEVLYLIGKKRGALVSGGQVDEDKVANLLLDEFRSGKLGKITIEKVGD
ncbi:MAG: ribosome biogenesis GTPase YlqF [Clostridia bacterium]|nr:ribosome biogenesis GTPase YlqF [Clostridia bacterium]